MITTKQFLIVFYVFFGVFLGVSCENYSVNPFNFQVNQKAGLSNVDFPKGSIFENPLKKKINEKRRLLFGNDNTNSAINAEREADYNEYSARRRTNFSEPNDERMPDWEGENLRLQFPIPVNPENSRNFEDFQVKQPFAGVKSSNHRYELEKWGNVYERDQTTNRWNGQKNFNEISHQDSRVRNFHNGRYGGVINNNEMNREDRRGDAFDRRVSITTLNDPEAGSMKNYHEDRIGSINSGYTGHTHHVNHYNRHPNTFWSPDFFRPEKGLVINLKTECTTPRQFNNQLVHKFVFTPRPQISTQPEYPGFPMSESSFVSPHKITPMYYL